MLKKCTNPHCEVTEIQVRPTTIKCRECGESFEKEKKKKKKQHKQPKRKGKNRNQTRPNNGGYHRK